MLMTTPAGWYPDPSNAAQQRYWDGNQWTEHVHPVAAATEQAAQYGAADQAAQYAAADTGAGAAAYTAEAYTPEAYAPAAAAAGGPAEGIGGIRRTRIVLIA